MTPGKIVLTTVLTVFTLLAFAAVGASTFLSSPAEAHGMRSHFAGANTHRGGHDRLLKHCKRLSPAHTRVVEAMVTAALDLDEQQESALQPVISVLDDWRADAAATCDSLPIESVDGGLAAMQQILATSAAALEVMRPAYAGFESTLNAEQRAHIADMLNRHHGR